MVTKALRLSTKRLEFRRCNLEFIKKAHARCVSLVRQQRDCCHLGTGGPDFSRLSLSPSTAPLISISAPSRSLKKASKARSLSSCFMSAANSGEPMGGRTNFSTGSTFCSSGVTGAWTIDWLISFTLEAHPKMAENEQTSAIMMSFDIEPPLTH